MLVDNDQRIVVLMTNVLKHLGFNNIFGARDGFQAVQMMREHIIDLIITDWELQPVEKDYRANLPSNPIVRSDMWLPVPPEDGARFVKYIRSSKYSPNPYIPIIMLIGIGLQNHIEYARDSGVNEVVLKPFSMEGFCERIIRVIDAPRAFVTAPHYKGPCRRREAKSYPKDMDRRKHEVRVFKHAS